MDLESGDSTKLKKIKVIELSEDTDGEKTVIVKKISKDGKEMEVNVEVMEGDHDKHKMMFISEGDEKPLMIVDGKEVEGGSIEDIDPENIETVNVYKGDKAIEEYGEKGKNGVVVIKTKK